MSKVWRMPVSELKVTEACGLCGERIGSISLCGERIFSIDEDHTFRCYRCQNDRRFCEPYTEKYYYTKRHGWVHSYTCCLCLEGEL